MGGIKLTLKAGRKSVKIQWTIKGPCIRDLLERKTGLTLELITPHYSKMGEEGVSTSGLILQMGTISFDFDNDIEEDISKWIRKTVEHDKKPTTMVFYVPKILEKNVCKSLKF